VSGRQRLDEALVSRGLFASRSRARDAVLRGTVRVDGAAVTKPGATVGADAEIAVDDPARGYVSRSALKLVAGLDAFAVDVAGRECLDVGASTGGFTQVLLERGAARVVALDVGHGQLHPSLAADPRVVSLEGLNARDLAAADLPAAPQVVVSDVSFISLTLALGPALDLASPQARLVALIKPQFEVGRDHLGKGGIVRDRVVAEAAADRVAAWISSRPGWRAGPRIPSPIFGSDGNEEYLIEATRSPA